MSTNLDWYDGRRMSYDGALCTIRCFIKEGQIPGTKGDWLGVEWDDPTRGKHNGTYKGKKYFDCKSSASAVASFIRPSRKSDSERSVLEAIKHKYVSSLSSEADVVIISGKIAEEIGFEKVSKEQSVLENLRIVLIDQLVVNGVASRSSSFTQIIEAQKELTEICPNIIELDLGYNPVETWTDVENICLSLPNLRVLKLNCIRMRSLASKSSTKAFANIVELHLNECLLDPFALISILGLSENPTFPKLRTLWMSQNELHTFSVSDNLSPHQYRSVETLMFENNFFTNLDYLSVILSLFPDAQHVSFQSNLIEDFGNNFEKSCEQSSAVYKSIHTLNLSQNNIQMFDFIDEIPSTFPNLTSLRISKNPVYEKAYYSTPLANPSETNYYLTIARIPSLKVLNYTNISSREREEGEIYYLSVTENEIKALLLNYNLSDSTERKQKLNLIQKKFPRYEELCRKHDRDSIIVDLSSSNANTDKSSAKYREPTQPTYPAGALASRLVSTTFYIPPSSKIIISPQPSSSSSSSSKIPQHSGSTGTFTRLLSTTLPATNIFALVSRTLSLPPLQFKLIFESTELDPIRDDLTTRSQIASTTRGNNNINGTSNNPNPYADWGDWDVDLPLVSPLPSTTSSSPTSDIFPINHNHNHNTTTSSTITATATATPHIKTPPSSTPGTIITSPEKSSDKHHHHQLSNNNNNKNKPNTPNPPTNITTTSTVTTTSTTSDRGYILKNNRKWKPRETEILMGMRAWGDYLDLPSSSSSSSTTTTTTTTTTTMMMMTREDKDEEGKKLSKWKDVIVRVEPK